jgi:signal peptidase I
MDKEYLIREAKEWASSIIFALILTLIIRTYVIQAFKIPSGSMIPTLLVGDKLFVNKYVYRFKKPKAGDIVVFKYPGDPHDPDDKDAGKKDFIKRLVAVEGQTVEIRDGKIYVDDKLLDEPDVFNRFYYYNASLYGSPHEKIRVPKDSYYVLGDNSASSRDSRFWGFVPKRNMLGKAVFRWWPPNRMGRLH